MSSAPALGVLGVSRNVIRELIEPLDERCELTSAMPDAALPVRACSAAPAAPTKRTRLRYRVGRIDPTGQQRRPTLNSAVLTGVTPESLERDFVFGARGER